MNKFQNLSQLTKQVRNLKKEGKRIGLITGCFDILHAGHIELFRFARKHCDVLIVGLENDQTIKLSKGKDRPIHPFKQRVLVTSELESVSYIFKIPIVITFDNSESVRNKYVKMTMKIKPDCIFTTVKTDRYLKNKKSSAVEMGIEILTFNPKTNLSTTSIAERIKREV